MNPSTLNQILSDSLYSIGYSDLRLPRDAVKLHEVVGIGAFGVVRRGIHKGKTVAVKEILVERLTPQEVNEAVHNELKTLYRLRNHKDSVTQLIGYYGFGPTVSIVLSYAENGDLKRYLVSGKLKGDWSRKASICADIAKALNNIHNEKIAHGDLKAENILLDKFLKPKITDFGVSKSLTSIARGKPLGHTLRYVAPERLKQKWGDPPTHEQCVLSDIFGYGMIMWEVATDGKMPYGDADDRVGVKISKSSYQKEDHLQNVGVLPDDVPKVFQAMVCNCLQWEPLARVPLKAVYEALDAYVRTAPPPLESSSQTISIPQYTRPQSVMLDRLQAAKDLFAANFDMTDPRTKMNIKVNKINFPKGETILNFHLERLGLPELAHCLAWIDFSRFSDIMPLGRTIYRGTVAWERHKHAYIKQRRQTPPEPFIAYGGEDVQHHYALKEVNLASKAEVILMAHFGCTAGKSRITMKFVGLSLHPETKKYLMVTECGEYNLEQYKVLDIEPEPGDGFWCTICNISLLLADCLESLHNSGFKHQNLDPTNVIMHKRSLRLINIDRPNHHRRQNYLPPEFFDSKPYTLESDIYCLGTLIWQLVTGTPPLGTASGRPDGLREDFPPGMPKKFKNIIEDCWRLDPFRRPSASKVWKRLNRCQEEMRSCKLSPETRAFIIQRRDWIVVEKDKPELHDDEDFVFVRKGGKNCGDSDDSNTWILEGFDKMDKKDF